MSVKCAAAGCGLEPDMYVHVVYEEDGETDYDDNYVCRADLAPLIAAHASTVKILKVEATDLGIW